MAPKKIEHKVGFGKLFLDAPDTELAGVIEETLTLARRFPVILRQIEADQDHLGKTRKRRRLEEKQWQARQTAALPGIKEPTEGTLREDALVLGDGCPRMSPEVTLVFLLLRGYTGELYGKWSLERLRDSRTLEAFLAQRNLRVPGLRTIGDNLNAVSNDTRELILDCQVALALAEELDDFAATTVDSTSVAANSEWPTDSGILLGLLGGTSRAGGRETVRLRTAARA